MTLYTHVSCSLFMIYHIYNCARGGVLTIPITSACLLVWSLLLALSYGFISLIIIFPMKKGDMNYKPIHTKYNYLIISSLKPCHIPSPKIFTRTIPIHARFHSTPYSPIMLNYVPYGTIFLSSIKCH